MDALGAQTFEQLTQSLLMDKLGPHLTVFGDGPDGGREASWNGEAPSFGRSETWSGYGILQAKFKNRSGSPAENLKWLKSTIKGELDDWNKPLTNRKEKPKFLLFATNVRLSSVPGSGKDEIHEFIDNYVESLGLPIAESRVLDYYEIRALLDAATSIRKRYAAFLTTGDIIAKLTDDLEDLELQTGRAIASYTARCLTEDSLVNLTQAGTTGDGRATIADVFIDLPAILPQQDINVLFDDSVDVEEIDTETEDSHWDQEYEDRSGIVRFLINDFNRIVENESTEGNSQQRTVLVGGPGQGKSTVTQWLAQLYRAEFLKGTDLAENPNIKPIIKTTEERRVKLELPRARARRWPMRVILTELADFLATSTDKSLLHYIAMKISAGSSYKITTEALRKWVSSYPCLLLIDGLDEVPASSNRSQVLNAIRNFFIEATSSKSDVFAVATTRPQGYSSEFSPEEYRHFQLEPLEVEEALKFAESLVAVRMGSGTAAEEKVMKRLKIASQEEHTMKLFESPLQVTILEVLLEKLHKAPNDRSRLYSSYFNVISQREQEKSGHLSDLLQKYESDVNYLHRQIGYVLQKRGAEVGETTSSLTLDEFDNYIKLRFKDQGHSEEDVEFLAGQFATLVTDRLVFLAKLESDKIGFELRSLQEFMAGEFIVNHPEQSVIPELHKIAHSAYWRNVALFAIGSIFSNKEYLRAEVTVLCAELNHVPDASKVILTGSDLAIDILRDGSCLSIPKFVRNLLHVAFSILDYPDAGSIRWLASLTQSDYGELIWDEATSTVPARDARWVGRAALLSELLNYNHSKASEALTRLFMHASKDLEGHLFNWARKQNNPLLATYIDGDLSNINPQPILSHVNPRWDFTVRKYAKTLPEWIVHLTKLGNAGQQDLQDREDFSRGSALLTGIARPLGLDIEAWTWLRDVTASGPVWTVLKSIASFSVNPNKSNLSAALRDLSSSDIAIPAATPWPLTACLRHASFSSKQSEFSTPEILCQISEAVSNGDFGDTDDWFAAQKRWTEAVPVTEQLVKDNSRATELDLFDLKGGTSGILPEALFYFGNHSVSPDSEDLLNLVETLVSNSTDQPIWLELAFYLVDISLTFSRSGQDSRMPESIELLKSCTNLPRVQRIPIRWIGEIPSRLLVDSLDFLRTIGSVSSLVGSLPATRSEELLRLSLNCSRPFPIARLALLSHPHLVADLTRTQLNELIGESDSDVQFMFNSCWNLFTASPDDIWSGRFDDDFTIIIDSTDNEFGVKWFNRGLSFIDEDLARQIASRGAFLNFDLHPEISDYWLELSRRITKTLAYYEGEND